LVLFTTNQCNFLINRPFVPAEPVT